MSFTVGDTVQVIVNDVVCKDHFGKIGKVEYVSPYFEACEVRFKDEPNAIPFGNHEIKKV